MKTFHRTSASGERRNSSHFVKRLCQLCATDQHFILAVAKCGWREHIPEWESKSAINESCISFGCCQGDSLHHPWSCGRSGWKWVAFVYSTSMLKQCRTRRPTYYPIKSFCRRIPEGNLIFTFFRERKKAMLHDHAALIKIICYNLYIHIFIHMYICFWDNRTSNIYTTGNMASLLYSNLFIGPRDTLVAQFRTL